MFTKFWARLAKWGQNGGLGHVPDVRVFSSAIPDDFSTTSQHPNFTIFDDDTKIVGEMQILDRIYEKFSFRGHLPQKPQTRRGQTGTSPVCLCAHPSIMFPHVLKRLNISSYFFQHMVAQSVNFFQY